MGRSRTAPQIVEIRSSGDGGLCSVQVRAAPLGVLTRLTILYGAGCEYY